MNLMGMQNNTVDFGLYEPQASPTLSLGDLVFIDEDNDGLFNNNDTGIEEVEVVLYDVGPDNEKNTADDIEIETQETNGFGEYLFTDIPGGLYFVKLTGVGIPNGYISSTGDGPYDMDGTGAYEPFTGTDNNVNNNDDGTQMGSMIMSDTIRLASGTETDDGDNDFNINPSVDFGIYLPQTAPVFDLALRKTLAVNQLDTVDVGDTIRFTISFFNQGNLPAYNITIVDYLPLSFSFDALLNPNWTLVGQEPTLLFPGPLAAGEMDSVEIALIINSQALVGNQNNYAEISSADDDTNSGNGTPFDLDSTPDNIFGNDPGGTPGGPADNVITGNGTGPIGSNVAATDEDDHDGATVVLREPSLNLGNQVFIDTENDGIYKQQRLWG